MNLLAYRVPWWFLLTCSFEFFLFAGTNQLAQNHFLIPARAGNVNDFAAVIDDQTKARLVNLLDNLQKKIGIEFVVVTVPSTAGQEIFAYSRQLASDWNVGARTTTNKSLLLVVAVNEKQSFTQFSRSVQGDLPEAVLGEMSQRMKALISAGDFSGGLQAGVQHFVGSMAQKLSLNAAEFEAPVAAAPKETASEKPAETQGSTIDAGLTVRPRIASAKTTKSPVSTDEARKPAEEPSKPVEKPKPDRKPVTAAASTRVTAPVVVKNDDPASPKKTDTAEKSARRTDDASTTTKKPETTEKPARERVETAAAPSKHVNTPEDDADESEEVELTLTLPLEARVKRLKEFLEDYPDSKSRPRAIELLVSSYAGIGDQKLKKGDGAGGLEQFMLAINTAPADMSEKLFAGVIAQIPANLFLRGERAAASEVAKSIEAKFGTDARRLATLSAFYVTTEQAGEAVRISTQAVTLGPEMAETHQALGLALHISLRLPEALAEYKRALEIDPNSKAAKRGAADLSRGLGKPEEALALYRQLFSADATDRAARAGLVISLFELGRTEEARTELAAALKADPNNLMLLAGLAYWSVAHNDLAQANEYGRKALEIEPRYTWSHMAMARTFVAQKKPLNAERALRFARQYGRFPTLDYELATTLVAAGLFGEASEVLLESFDWKNDQIETRLAGRTTATADNFLELLAPERRAAIFQSTAADSEANAKVLKQLLVFTVLSNQEKPNEKSLVAAAKAFASGNDPAQVHRQLYAASRLLQKGVGFSAAHELAEAARVTADAGLSVPEVTLAVQADEYRDIRARAIANGGTPDVVEAPRNVLSNLMRGRIEDISGWALFNQDKPEEAVDHLQRAANVLPARTPGWRTTMWHLGAAQDRLDRREEALVNYIKSYNVGDPDPVKRSVIERLYKKMHGSLAGLDEKIGSTPPVSSSETGAPADSQPASQPVSSPATTSDSSPTASATSSPPSSTPEPSPAPATETATPTEVRKQTSPPVSLTKPTNAESAIVERMNKPAPSVVSIKGRVFDSTGNPIANVVVVLIGPQGTVLASTTDSRGNYSFSVAPSTNSYRVIPSKDGFTFEPGDRVLSSISDDQTELNFVGLPKRGT